jgi:hypothetical protein
MRALIAFAFLLFPSLASAATAHLYAWHKTLSLGVNKNGQNAIITTLYFKWKVDGSTMQTNDLTLDLATGFTIDTDANNAIVLLTYETEGKNKPVQSTGISVIERQNVRIKAAFDSIPSGEFIVNGEISFAQ